MKAMKLNYTVLCAAAALFGVLSCTRLELVPEGVAPNGKTLSFSAEWADVSQTKTSIHEGGPAVWWTAAEDINVFTRTSSARFISTNTEPSDRVTFSGQIAISTGSNEFWAVYPYDEGNSFDGQLITLTVPVRQAASAGTFADHLFPAIAKTTGTSFSFFNVCGGAVFSVKTEGVRYVTFRSLGGEDLVGTVSVGFDAEGKPSVQSVTDGSDTVVLTPPDGGTFEVGKKYYAVLLPQVLENGLSVTLQTEDQEARRVKTGPIEIHRSLFGRLLDVDEGLEYGEITAIPFADERLEALLVGHFDTDGDGLLSPAEANAVTSLADFFPSGSMFDPVIYKSFDEFRWFTSVTEVPDYCFAYWTQLESITLPESVTAIRTGAFLQCGNLTEIQIPGQVKTIEFEAFAGAGLTSVEIPASVTSLQAPFIHCNSLSEITGKGATDDHRGLVYTKVSGETVFVAIAPFGLTEYDIPSGVTVVGDWVFVGCNQLSRIGIPDSVTRIERAAFHGCSALTSISIPEGVAFLGDYVFRDCSSLQRLTLPESITSVGDISLDIWDPVSGCTALSGFYGKFASSDHRSLIVDDVYVAFALASGSDPLEIPSQVKVIGEGALQNANLKGIFIPEGVTSISINAFQSCVIRGINVPSTVTSLKEQAFANVTGNIFFRNLTPPKATESTFSSGNNSKIYVPATALDTYKSAEGWSRFANKIFPLPTEATCAGVISGPEGADYIVTGNCVRIANANYGNWYLEDETGQIYIYGTVTDNGTYNWPSFGIGLGDQVTVMGPKTNYNGIIELVDVRVVNVLKTLLTIAESPSDVAATGGQTSVTLLNSGGDISVNILDEAKSWISLNNIVTTPDGNGNERAVVTFTVSPNQASPRETKVSFISSTNHQKTTLPVSFYQEGVTGTAEMPFTVEQAIAYANETGDVSPVDVFIKGIVSKVEEGGEFSAQSGYATFWISTDGVYHDDKSKDFQAFRVYYLGNQSWKQGNDQVAVGDRVVLCGRTTLYKGLAETSARAAWLFKHYPAVVDLNVICTRADSSTYKLYWASCNLGAGSPEEFGSYYGWGETQTKTNYWWDSYKWVNAEMTGLTKYCPAVWAEVWGGAGDPDDKLVLDLADDAANAKMGGDWRMPTGEEWDALIEQCDWTWTVQNGVSGYQVKSKTSGNSIFLPAAGCYIEEEYSNDDVVGCYWSASINTDAEMPDTASFVGFSSEQIQRNAQTCVDRCYGLSIRPVMVAE